MSAETTTVRVNRKIRTVSTARLTGFVGNLERDILLDVDEKLRFLLGL